MDPSNHNQRDTRDLLPDTEDPRDTAGDAAADNPHRVDGRDTDRQARYASGYTKIPPNESRRSKIKTMAQKEEEDLQRWKEANRAPPVHLTPERLGGNVTLDEARQKQLTDLRCSKLQKKMKKEDLDKRRRQEEEEKLQRMKTEKREMAERLEERRRQEEQRRREQFRQDHLRMNDSFMQRFERSAPGPLESSSATHTSSGNEAVVSKQRGTEAERAKQVELDHQRVNKAFLDKLQGQGSRADTEGEGFQEAEGSCHGHNPGTEPPSAYLCPDSERSCSSWMQEADPESDYDWALMKLMNSFPDCSRVFLEDILLQCNSDYEQAYMLLICTLS